MSLEVAPNAIRASISLVPCVMAYESTPYNPSDASSSASRANVVIRVVFCAAADNSLSVIEWRV